MKLRKISKFPIITQNFADLYELADVMEVSTKTASKTLDGERAFTLKEKERICKHLKLSRAEVFGEVIEESENQVSESAAEDVHIGDEVVYGSARGIVVCEPYVIGMNATPIVCINFISHMCSCELSNVKKTGRHFKEIEKLSDALTKAL